MAVSIAIETPLQDDVAKLVEELNAFAFERTPAEYCHHLTPEDMANDQVALFIARDDGEAIGCGALRRHEGETAEVKRMFVRPGARQGGVGRMILDAILTLAEKEGFQEIALETGNNFDGAIALYERAGFSACEPVLGYPDSPFTSFYRKQLCESAEA